MEPPGADPGPLRRRVRHQPVHPTVLSTTDGWRPRLVGCDLDGTLLDPDRHITPRTARVVRRVEAAGVPFVLVTGRPPRWLGVVADELDHRGIAVCANGAVIWDLRTGTMVGSDPLDPDVLGEVTRRLRELLPQAMFAVERDDVFHHEADYDLGPHLGGPSVRSAAYDDLVGAPAVKLLVSDPRADPDELLAAAREALGEVVTITHSSTHGLLEVSAPGVTKASGLARVAERTGVSPEDVLVFGDMPNDLPMFGWAGRAVAVANAHPAVLEAADEQTASNAEDGVAAYLEVLFPAVDGGALG